MISPDGPDALQRRAAFVAWFDALPRVRSRQEQVGRWLAGHAQSIPLLNPDDADLPRDLLRRLRQTFGGKCLYCEQPVLGDDEANLHLYRPPFQALQERDGAVDNPDCYKWLRWDPHNLQLTCAACNQAKATLFPVAGRRARRGDLGDSLRAERPLILNPLDHAVNPLRHLHFDHETGLVSPAQLDNAPSVEGACTIDALELNRPELVLARQERARALLERWEALMRLGEPERRARLVAELPLLRAACADDAPFAGLHRQLLWRLTRALRLTQANGWPAFRAELARWNGASTLPDGPDPEQLRLEERRLTLTGLWEQAQRDPAQVSAQMLQRAKRERQQIDALKARLRGRGLPVDDLPIDRAELERNAPRALPGVDVLLVTVTEVEARAVLSQSRSTTGKAAQRLFINGKPYRDLGVFGGARTVMVQSGMGAGGPAGATLTVDEGIRELRPRTVIMVGIAFGVNPDEQQIGDILVAEQLLCYDSQRWGTDHSGAAEIKLRGARPYAPTSVLNRFRDATLDWHGANVTFGLLLSGEKLIDNLEFRDALRRSAPEAIGGEMEGSGLYAAAHLNKRDWILVKAISDWADGNKAQDKAHNQRCAATNAAAFVLHALQSGGFAG
ncbi:MAG TPA: hypothetical protein PKD53_18595 [Chloroflexaceae bacterium]|nr:hypothetical protein [Chloroflexaceae bacterium]